VSPRTRPASPEEARKIVAQARLLPCDDCGVKPGSPCTQPGKGRSVCKSRWIAAAIALRRQARAARQTPEQVAVLARLPRLTEEQIEAGRSPRGGWTRKQLAEWNVPWPPPAGWRRALLRGEEVSE
jgi:ribosome-binding protein aMBF1 (putative translation factor)